MDYQWFFVGLVIATFVLGVIGMRYAARRQGLMLWRLLGFAIDLTIIAVPIYLASFAFAAQMIWLGEGGLVVGFIAFVLYFALLGSEVAGGGTIGNRILNLRIADAAGNPISFVRALVRAVILAAPPFVVQVALKRLFPDQAQADTAAFAWNFIVVGIGGAIFYLLLANRRTEQALHDLVVGAYVVGKQPIATSGIGPTHTIVIMAIFATSLILPSLPLSWFDQWPATRAMILPLKLERSFNNDPSLTFVGFSEESTNGDSSLELDIHLYEPVDDVDAVIKRVASRAFALEPNLLGFHRLAIRAGYGWNFGIAAAESGVLRYGSVEQWRQGTEQRHAFSSDIAGTITLEKQQ